MIKKHYILYFLLLIAVSHGNAQNANMFLKTYFLLPHNYSESYGVAETPYGYMIAGINLETENNSNYWAYALIGVNWYGDTIWTKSYRINNGGVGSGMWIHDFLKKEGDNYYSTANIYYPNSYWTSVLIKINEFGDTLWTKEYSPADSILNKTLVTMSANKTKDNGYILSALAGNGTYSNVCLIKTDSLGNEIWRKIHNINNNTLQWVYSAIEDSLTGRFVFTGFRFSNNKDHSYIFITDSIGNIIIQRNFGGTHGSILLSIQATSDNRFIASGNEYTGNTHGSWDLAKGLLIKFDIQGNLIWKKVYGEEQMLNYFTSMVITQGDSIVVSGQYDSIYTQGLGLNSMFQLYKMAPNGDIVWKRYFDITQPDSIGGGYVQDLPQSLIKTSDGGYCITGYSAYSNQNPFLLLKLNEWGCDTLNCQYVGVNELENKPNINIYPNPANSIINIELPLSMPYKNAYIEIKDLTGKILHTQIITEYKNTLNVSFLKPSLYIVSLISDNKIITHQKLIIKK